MVPQARAGEYSVAGAVGRLIPPYAAHGAAAQRHARQHPLTKTQDCSEELDAQGDMFDARRKALMLADAADLSVPSLATGRQTSVSFIELAGEDETGSASILDPDGCGLLAGMPQP